MLFVVCSVVMCVCALWVFVYGVRCVYMYERMCAVCMSVCVWVCVV